MEGWLLVPIALGSPELLHLAKFLSPLPESSEPQKTRLQVLDESSDGFEGDEEFFLNEFFKKEIVDPVSRRPSHVWRMGSCGGAMSTGHRALSCPLQTRVRRPARRHRLKSQRTKELVAVTRKMPSAQLLFRDYQARSVLMTVHEDAMPGCVNLEFFRGKCRRHNPKCARPGCGDYVRSNGKCIKHGGRAKRSSQKYIKRAMPIADESNKSTKTASSAAKRRTTVVET
ncbi:hypothetical protein PHYSODRAFT_305404 [Phytophthora sojae]|uniref:Uncharacterized protein n=1 Tax=Phytophthora sojae (strain P6497) TaxID=1094619 RepID=G5A3A1_PHYSP|nr:hypothetical protein PHYSODRAFT_305404 [Phytophthora sojae]EGZ10141.1 hypothetical protein PHYSODRAFT_305404 [Phytophthora sojae]|eukprot:XP_009535002.1 hypothetical protein PHYSODRAFT_305404 [Phytophthora sojae]